MILIDNYNINNKSNAIKRKPAKTPQQQQ